MDDSYKSLFIELCRSAQVLAEQVMDYDKKYDDTEGYKTAEAMRNDYQQVEDSLKGEAALGYNEYVKLLAAGYIVINNLQDRVTEYQKAIDGYKTVVIPKLSRIMEEGKDNPEVFNKLVNELFQSNA